MGFFVELLNNVDDKDVHETINLFRMLMLDFLYE